MVNWGPKDNHSEAQRGQKGHTGNEHSLEHGKKFKITEYVMNMIPEFLGRTIKKWTIQCWMVQ